MLEALAPYLPSAIGAIGNFAANAWTQHKQNQAWNKTNEYNLPRNQVQRLKDADLNPLLAAGAGNAVEQRNVAETPGLSPAIDQYQSLRRSNAEIALDQENADLAAKKAQYQEIVNGKQAGLMDAQTRRLMKQVWLDNVMGSYQQSKLRNDLRLTDQKIAAGSIDQAIKLGLIKEEHKNFQINPRGLGFSLGNFQRDSKVYTPSSHVRIHRSGDGNYRLEYNNGKRR